MEDDEGGDDKANLIREMIVQLIISREHRKRIKEIEDNLEGRKDCSKLRDARDILSGTKKCEVLHADKGTGMFSSALKAQSSC